MILRFFVIDDVEGIRLLFHEYLNFLGHEVICAEHPMTENICTKIQCTCEVACADGYFVDLSMPYMSGIDSRGYGQTGMQNSITEQSPNVWQTHARGL